MKHSFFVKATFSCLACGTLSFVLLGCGGGDTNKSSAFVPVTSPASALGTGRARLTIQWPARSASRLVPDAANSIVVEVLRGDGENQHVFDTKVVARPADVSVPSVVTFDSLPVDTLTLRASAHPNPDGTGVSQAVSETPLVIVAGETTDFGTMTMGTTVATVSVASPSGSVAQHLNNKPQQWTVTARDHDNARVLIAASRQQWESSNPLVATVDARTGLVTPVGIGTTTLTATDTESGVSGSSPLSVSASPAQFNPYDPAYAPSSSGGLTLTNGHACQFNTDAADAPTLVDTTNNTTVATGKYVTQSFGAARTSVTYAVFTFTGDVHIGGGSVVTGRGANPVVLLTQGTFTLDGSAKLNVAADGRTPGAGGSGPGSGPGVGKFVYFSRRNNDYNYTGGGSFGLAGGSQITGLSSGTTSAGPVYGADFADPTTPHLQGGSGSCYSNTFTSDISGAGGGAIYVGSVGSLSINYGTITAAGGNGTGKINNYYAGGSGGGIALWSGTAVTLSGARFLINGGAGSTRPPYTSGGGGIGINHPPVVTVHDIGGNGGGGRLLIGYPVNSAAPDTSFFSYTDGVSSVETFNGF